jgi:hypothetical protein
LFKPESSLGAIEAGADPFEHSDFVTGLEGFGQVVTDGFGTEQVVGADEWDGEILGFEDFVIEFVVDIDDNQAGLFGASQGWDEGFGICRGDHDRFDFGGDHFFDDGGLSSQVPFIFDPVDDQIVLI